MRYLLILLLCAGGLLAGCASSRSIYIRMGDLTVQARESANWPFIIGEDATTVTFARTADGATTATVETGKTKNTIGNLGAAAIGAAAGFAAAGAVMP